MGWRRRHKIRRAGPLGSVYRNPAAAVSECKREGKADTPGILYECAIGKMPASAHTRPQWAREARRLAQLAGPHRRRARRRKARS